MKLNIFILYLFVAYLHTSLYAQQEFTSNIKHEVLLTTSRLCLKDIFKKIESHACFKKVFNQSQIILLEDIYKFVRKENPSYFKKNLHPQRQLALHIKLITKQLSLAEWEQKINTSLKNFHPISISLSDYKMDNLLNINIPKDSKIYLEVQPIKKKLKINIYTSNQQLQQKRLYQTVYLHQKVKQNNKDRVFTYTTNPKRYILIYKRTTKSLGTIRVSIPAKPWRNAEIGDNIIAIAKKTNKKYKAKIIQNKQAQILE